MVINADGEIRTKEELEKHLRAGVTILLTNTPEHAFPRRWSILGCGRTIAYRLAEEALSVGAIAARQDTLFPGGMSQTFEPVQDCVDLIWRKNAKTEAATQATIEALGELEGAA